MKTIFNNTLKVVVVLYHSNLNPIQRHFRDFLSSTIFLCAVSHTMNSPVSIPRTISTMATGDNILVAYSQHPALPGGPVKVGFSPELWFATRTVLTLAGFTDLSLRHFRRPPPYTGP
jgi:hypothetical protein